MSYLLHYAPDNASLIVRLALLELGLGFRTQWVDRARQGQNSPAYLAKVPTGLIPALETEGQVMFETGAILLHLCDSHPSLHEGRLFPGPGSAERAAALTWLFFLANTLHADCRLQFYPARYAGTSPAHGAMITATHRRIAGHFDLLEAALLREGDLFWQGGPSILALYACVIARWMQLYPAGQDPWFDLGHWPGLRDLAAQCETRPSARTAAKDEGLGATIFTAPSLPLPAADSHS